MVILSREARHVGDAVIDDHGFCKAFHPAIEVNLIEPPTIAPDSLKDWGAPFDDIGGERVEVAEVEGQAVARFYCRTHAEIISQ